MIKARLAKTLQAPTIVSWRTKSNMRILIAAIGRFRNGPEYDLYQNYVKRLHWPIDLKEFETKQKLSMPARKKVEENLRRASLGHQV